VALWKNVAISISNNMSVARKRLQTSRKRDQLLRDASTHVTALFFKFPNVFAIQLVE
jgi:hypothetical protein